MFVLFFMPEMKATTHKSQSSSCLLSVSKPYLYFSVMLGLTALIASMSNLQPKGLHLKWSEYNTPLPFLGYQPVLVLAEQIQDTFSVRNVVPPPVVGKT